MRRFVPICLLLAGCAANPAVSGPTTPAPAATAGLNRRMPFPLDTTPAWRQALEQGTRAANGAPGPRYWINTASYDISARIDPDQHQVDGTVTIVYRNNSPDTLPTLHLELTQNIHAPGVVRMQEAEVTGGMELKRVTVAGQALSTEGRAARYVVSGTRLAILPPAPLPPGGSVTIAIDYGFAIPQAGASSRMGYDDNLVFMAYWYPQMAVYDDIVGWQTDPFVGSTEFYSDFGSYSYSVDVPASWVVMGTGTLQNPQVLKPAVLDRLRRAESSDANIAVLSPSDFPGNSTVATSGRVTWKFRADSVRDVAFTLSRNMHWDARRTSVGDRNGDGTNDYTRIDAIWRTTAPRWKDAAKYGAQSISFLSGYTGLPYPYPHMTVVEGEGIVGGGMEYPQMTLISGYNEGTDADLFSVIAHELAHMWIPMIVSSDERRYSWMDEGTTMFNEDAAEDAIYPGTKHYLDEHQQYLQIAGSGMEGELMRWSAYHYTGGAYLIASYPKPAAVLAALRGVIGEDAFNRGFKAFFDRWKYKHPYPWDLWNTFEAAAGRDLDWFWYEWYFTTWTLDQAVASVTANGSNSTIVVQDNGRIAMPTNLRITLAGGETVTRTIDVEHWLAGNRQATVTVPGTVTRVVIDPDEWFPDTNRGNNSWKR